MTTPRVDRPAKFAPYTPPSHESLVIPDTVAELWPHPVNLAPAPVELAPPAVPVPVAPVQVPAELVPTPIEVPAPQPVAPTPTPTELAPQREDPLPASAYVIRESRFDGLTVLCAAMYTTYAAIIVGILSIIGYVLYPVVTFIQLVVSGIINAGPMLGSALLIGLGVLGVSKFVTASTRTASAAKPSMLSRLVTPSKPAKLVTYTPVSEPSHKTARPARVSKPATIALASPEPSKASKPAKPAKLAVASRVKTAVTSPAKSKPARSTKPTKPAVAAPVNTTVDPRVKSKPARSAKPVRTPKPASTSIWSRKTAPAEAPKPERVQKRKTARTAAPQHQPAPPVKRPQSPRQAKPATPALFVAHLVSGNWAACGVKVPRWATDAPSKHRPRCPACAAREYKTRIVQDDGSIIEY